MFEALAKLVRVCGLPHASRIDFAAADEELQKVYDASDEAFYLKSKLGRYEFEKNPSWRSGNDGPVDRWTSA